LQVLSLNLTNLVLLVVLKGLLLGAAMLGAGHLGARGRSLEGEPEDEGLISRAELLLLSSYLLGDATTEYGCLFRVACQEPKKTNQYIAAADILIKSAKMFQE
jgi:hypothetical protein